MDELNQRKKTNVEHYIEFNRLLIELVLENKENTELYKNIMAELQLRWRDMPIQDRNDIRNFYNKVG